jgi:hypothetical protein
MDVVLHRAVEAHLVRIREKLSLPVGLDEADEDLVARVDPDRPTAIVYRHRNLAFSI